MPRMAGLWGTHVPCRMDSAEPAFDFLCVKVRETLPKPTSFRKQGSLSSVCALENEIAVCMALSKLSRLHAGPQRPITGFTVVLPPRIRGKSSGQEVGSPPSGP
jgi:hypothetical protein